MPCERSVDEFIPQNHYLFSRSEPSSRVYSKVVAPIYGPANRPYRPFSELSFADAWRHPLPYADSLTGFYLRMTTLAARKSILDIEGPLDHLHARHDPFIVVLNHSQRLEALLIPGLLFFYRLGKPIHFLADWQFLIMPVVSSLYRKSQVIIVSNKDIKPRFLNFIKPLFEEKTSAFERAAQRLADGSPVGIFPEGTVNRDPQRLMRGLPGGAKLSIQAQVPVLPVGVRFPEIPAGEQIPDGAKMTLHIGDFIPPPKVAETESRKGLSAVREHHGDIMTALANLSGKAWHARANKRRRYVV